MKQILTITGLLLSLQSYSQSYLILDNGVTLTTDKAGYVYDFGNFFLPYKVSHTGGQFFAVDDKLVSVDEKGYLYRKDEKAPKRVEGKGLNYLLTDKAIMYTFDTQGYF